MSKAKSTAHSAQTTDHPEIVTPADVAEQYISETMGALPAGSSFVWGNGVYCVRRGVNTVGEGKTLARAIRVINAHYGQVNGEGPTVLLDEQGEPIPAE